MSESTILVTGATGFLGATLVRQLVKNGSQVRILRRASSKLDLLGSASEHVEHAIGDITDVESLESAMHGIRQVYHAAAFVGFGGKKDRERLFKINVQGTANVVNAALEVRVERLVHVSSIAALGRTENQSGLIDEKQEWATSKSNTAYAESKHLAEMEIHRSIAEGLDAVMINPAVIFGPGRRAENTMEIAEKLLAGELPATPTGGTCVVDVEDVALGMQLAMGKGETGSRTILGGHNMPWSDIFDTIAKPLGVERPQRMLGRRPAMALAHVFETVATITRTRALITKETARSSTSTHYYSNQKALDLGCTFRPFSETAERIAAKLLA